MEVRGHLDLRTTFTDGAASRTENTRYLIVNAPSAYNVLLGRPMLNRLRAVVSTRHMKMKLPDLGVSDENQIKEAFINEGRGHSPSHLKFFLLVFSKLKKDIK